MPHVSELHRHHSPQKFEELGRDLYRQKKYTEALEAFNASAKSAGAATLDLLDSRAATHEKLGNLDAALRDGRAMIEMSKGEVQGYLRTAKILQQMDKADLALKIYQRGLRLTTVTSMNYELLHKLHDKLTRKLAKPEAKDILAVLPVELIEMIFVYLPFRQLCKCLRVSKHWKSLLTAWPRFWARIDVSGSKKPIRERTIKPYISYAKGTTSEATLNCSDVQASKVLDVLLQRCKSLSRIAITGGGFLGESLTGSAVLSQDTAMRIMANCANLEEVSFGSVMQDPYPTAWPQCQKLRSFEMKFTHLEGRSRPSNVTFKEICPVAPLLEILKLEEDTVVDVLLGDFDMTGLKELHVKGFRITALPQGLLYHLPNSLRTLSMRSTNCFLVGTIQPFLEFPHLDTLLIEEQQEVDLETVARFLRLEGTSVVKFAASSSYETPDQLVKILLLSRMKSVESVDMSGSEKLTDKEIAIIAETLQNLRSITLSGTAITGVGVKKLIQNLPKLRQLVIRDCTQISPDAVAWARQQKELKVDYHVKAH